MIQTQEYTKHTITQHIKQLNIRYTAYTTDYNTHKHTHTNHTHIHIHIKNWQRLIKTHRKYWHNIHSDTSTHVSCNNIIRPCGKSIDLALIFVVRDSFPFSSSSKLSETCNMGKRLRFPKQEFSKHLQQLILKPSLAFHFHFQFNCAFALTNPKTINKTMKIVVTTHKIMETILSLFLSYSLSHFAIMNFTDTYKHTTHTHEHAHFKLETSCLFRNTLSVLPIFLVW